jgi:hypothetical protein
METEKIDTINMLNYKTFPITQSASKWGEELPPLGSSVIANA